MVKAWACGGGEEVGWPGCAKGEAQVTGPWSPLAMRLHIQGSALLLPIGDTSLL